MHTHRYLAECPAALSDANLLSRTPICSLGCQFALLVAHSLFHARPCVSLVYVSRADYIRALDVAGRSRHARRHCDPRLCARLAECGRALDPARAPHRGVVGPARAREWTARTSRQAPTPVCQRQPRWWSYFPFFMLTFCVFFVVPLECRVSQCRSVAVSPHRVEYYLLSTLSTCLCGIERRMISARLVWPCHGCFDMMSIKYTGRGYLGPYVE